MNNKTNQKIQGWTAINTKHFDGLQFSVLGSTEDEMRENFWKVYWDLFKSSLWMPLEVKEQ